MAQINMPFCKFHNLPPHLGPGNRGGGGVWVGTPPSSYGCQPFVLHSCPPPPLCASAVTVRGNNRSTGSWCLDKIMLTCTPSYNKPDNLPNLTQTRAVHRTKKTDRQPPVHSDLYRAPAGE